MRYFIALLIVILPLITHGQYLKGTGLGYFADSTNVVPDTTYGTEIGFSVAQKQLYRWDRDSSDWIAIRNVPVSNILWVSPNGNNSTAVKGDPFFPWADPWSARGTAVAGDLVYILPGTYTSTGSTLYDQGVTYYAVKGVRILIGAGHRFMSQFSTAPDGCNFLGNGTVTMQAGSLKFLDMSAAGAEINVTIELDSLILDHTDTGMAVIAAANKIKVDVGVLTQSNDEILVLNSGGAPPQANLFEFNVGQLWLNGARVTAHDCMSLIGGEDSKYIINIDELYFTNGNSATHSIFDCDFVGAGSKDNMEWDITIGKAVQTSGVNAGFALVKFNESNVTATNSSLTLDCGDCLMDVGTVLELGSGATSTTSKMYVTGQYTTGSNVGTIQFRGTPSWTATFNNLIVANDGSVAAINSPAAYTLTVAGVYDRNAIILDPDITYDSLTEY